MQIKFLSEW